MVQAQSLKLKSYLTITVLDKIRYSLANNQKQKTFEYVQSVAQKKIVKSHATMISKMIILRKCLSYLKADNDMSSITQIIFYQKVSKLSIFVITRSRLSLSDGRKPLHCEDHMHWRIRTAKILSEIIVTNGKKSVARKGCRFIYLLSITDYRQ